MTNQRLRFDVDIGGRWLGIGNQVCSFSLHHDFFFDLLSLLMVQNGDVSLFDLDHESVVETETENDLGYGGSVQEIAPTLTFKAHGGLSSLIGTGFLCCVI
jgi:telomerase Cajal body protein 1